MPILYASHDNGEFYRASEIDDPDHPEGFERYVVADTITLTADDLYGHDGNLIEVLLSAGVIQHVEPETA